MRGTCSQGKLQAGSGIGDGAGNLEAGGEGTAPAAVQARDFGCGEHRFEEGLRGERKEARERVSQGRHPGGRLSGWWGRGTYKGQADWGVVLGQGTDLHLVRVGFLGDPGAVVTGVGWVGCSLKDPRLAREAWHPGQWAAGASKACPGGSVA